MANRTKTDRNQKIMAYWERGYRQISIARMFKMTQKAVNAVIRRERIKRNGSNAVQPVSERTESKSKPLTSSNSGILSPK